MTSLSPFVPIAVTVLVLWGLVRFTAAKFWHLLIALIGGIILSGTVLGPDISNAMSQLSGGRLH